ncbi:TetR/AcrR family transcriptional regulator [Streptomyces sp. SID3343]|uniref:TetR/AcrR family transcriptional regulator n=1 Tax=Streptomyces sp. SID3343 TaxID=2690260 RepID=UPI00136A2F99|nr:TetR/AcrR family transcriptional regulator [Streptomyces sp. SID3343]MYW04933.1 TetR family transcriptional regulator [Streptomyces sp. SID3343]
MSTDDDSGDGEFGLAATGDGRQPQRKRDREATRAALLAAARVRFAREGYTGTNVRTIAGDVGVDAGLVFRYFGSKRKLFDEVSAEDARKAEAVLAGPPELLPLRLLETILAEESSELVGEHPFIAMLRAAGDATVRDQLRDQVCETYIANIRKLVRGQDADLRAELLSAWLLGISVVRSVIRSETLSAATVADVAPYFEQVRHVLLGGDDDAGP